MDVVFSYFQTPNANCEIISHAPVKLFGTKTADVFTIKITNNNKISFIYPDKIIKNKNKTRLLYL